MKIARTLAVAAAVASASLVAVTSAQTSAAPASAASPDFDGDGKADLAAFVQDADEVRSLRIWYGNGDVVTIDPASVGAGDYDLYGPLLARDLNGDGKTDLVFPTGRYDGVRVTIALGSTSGLDLATAREINVSSSTEVMPDSLALIEDPTPRLAVGLTGGSGTGPGSVALYDIDSAGAPVGARVMLTPGSGKIPKISGSSFGPQFGDALATSGDRLFVGAPFATVSGKKYAGAIVAVTFSGAGASSAKLVTQSSSGVTGAAGTNDYFGQSLAARGNDLVVGTPNDDVESIKGPGSVQVFSLTNGALKPVRRISEASKGVPGVAERYDYFGRSVALGTVCSGRTSVIVGGSGEAIGSTPDAGSVWHIPLASGCTAYQLYEGHGLGGRPKAVVGLGRYVSVLRDRGDSVDDVVIAGSGSYSEGPNGRIIRWTPGTGETFRFDQLIGGIAGR